MLAALLATTLALPAAPCTARDASTIAVGRETPAGWVVETKTADEPWQRALGPVERAICPRIEAAPDGTIVLAVADDADETSLVTVRRPGAAFGAPMTIRHREGRLQLEAVTGGHTAMLWSDWRDTDGDLFAEADGVRTRLEHVRGFGPGDLVLAPDGTATATWIEVEPVSKGYAEFRAGRWSAPVEVYRGRHRGWFDSGVALAQAPSGRRLLAWMATRELRVDVEGEPTTTIARPRVRKSSIEVDPRGKYVIEPESVLEIAGALIDDGSAVIVYQTPDGLFAVDRARRGPWSKPHRLARHLDHLGADVTLAPDGRALVTWPLEGDGELAVSGQAGGRWRAPEPYTAPAPAPADALTAWLSSRALAPDRWTRVDR